MNLTGDLRIDRRLEVFGTSTVNLQGSELEIASQGVAIVTVGDGSIINVQGGTLRCVTINNDGIIRRQGGAIIGAVNGNAPEN